jgi:methionyl-tRNA formyltransferase
MRLIFLGNGPLATPILARLARSEHEVALVVARPDRPKGKHQRIEPGPVARLAQNLGLPLHQSEDVNSRDALDRLRSVAADLLVVADFGQILSPACLQTARLGGVNAHASLLPKYRGAAPVVWAIYHGESETGVSIIQMSPRMDAGAILSRRAVPIGPEQTAGELEATLAEVAAEMVAEAVDALEAGSVEGEPQDSAVASRAPKVKKSDGLIRWARGARDVANQVRAMQPWPIAYTHWRHGSSPPLRLQILKATPEADATPETPGASPGTVVEVGRDRLAVQTGEGRLVIRELQPAGKRPMTVDAFLRGRRVEVGDRFE